MIFEYRQRLIKLYILFFFFQRCSKNQYFCTADRFVQISMPNFQLFKNAKKHFHLVRQISSCSSVPQNFLNHCNIYFRLKESKQFSPILFRFSDSSYASDTTFPSFHCFLTHSLQSLQCRSTEVTLMKAQNNMVNHVYYCHQ